MVRRSFRREYQPEAVKLIRRNQWGQTPLILLLLYLPPGLVSQIEIDLTHNIANLL